MFATACWYKGIYFINTKQIYLQISINFVYICFMKKDTQILIKVSEDERDGFRRAADIAGIGVSAWARQKLRAAAVQELQTIGESVPFITAPPVKSKEA